MLSWRTDCHTKPPSCVSSVCTPKFDKFVAYCCRWKMEKLSRLFFYTVNPYCIAHKVDFFFMLFLFAKKNSVTCLFFFCKNCFFLENRYANLRWLFYNNKKIDYLYWWILFSVIIVSFCELVCYDMYIYTIYSYTVYTYIVESQSCTVGNAIAYLWKLSKSARSLQDCTIDDPLFICMLLVKFFML